MSGDRAALLAHLALGATTTCQCWSLTRRDGVQLGFTDHDHDLSFDGLTYRASSGMTARALQHGTGLAVDNSEALGALSDSSVSEADLIAGRYDGAEVVNLLVNWQDVSQRMVQFRGSFGEVGRSAGAFRAELRGLSEVLNQVQGQAYQKTCSAVLGDGRCGFDLDQAGFSAEVALTSIEAPGVYRIASLDGIANGWFSRGRIRVLEGPAAGLVGLVKFDQQEATSRRLELWVDFPAEPQVGDLIRLEAGCDKTAATCQSKFSNFLNFRGFPHIPGEDWMTGYPVSGQGNDGGSLVR